MHPQQPLWRPAACVRGFRAADRDGTQALENTWGWPLAVPPLCNNLPAVHRSPGLALQTSHGCSSLCLGLGVDKAQPEIGHQLR